MAKFILRVFTIPTLMLFLPQPFVTFIRRATAPSRVHTTTLLEFNVIVNAAHLLDTAAKYSFAQSRYRVTLVRTASLP